MHPQHGSHEKITHQQHMMNIVMGVIARITGTIAMGIGKKSPKKMVGASSWSTVPISLEDLEPVPDEGFKVFSASLMESLIEP